MIGCLEGMLFTNSTWLCVCAYACVHVCDTKQMHR